MTRQRVCRRAAGPGAAEGGSALAVHIETVERESPAWQAGLRPGMEIISINGKGIVDGLDYEFYTVAEELDILLRDGTAERHVCLQKQEYQPLGCGFETYLIDRQKHCRNKCIFCFVDQMPKGMRPSLYFKDDDERLSFLFGNYITLTNLGERELQRIIDMRFSPINISVHTVDSALRCQMMGNPKAGEALAAIPRLAKAGIELNFQLVLCPGVNDGEKLVESLRWLAGFYPQTQSIAAVPVGLTRHRQGLARLRPYTAAEAAAQLDIMLQMGDACVTEHGQRLVYPSDEWFLLAEREIPPADFYNGYLQLENGVGMWRLLLDEFADALAERFDEDAPPCPKPPPQADIVVGTLVEPLFLQLDAMLQTVCPGARLHVHAVRNEFFGHDITVTGLLTGRDIMAQLAGRLQTGRLLLPARTLRAEGDLLLDDTTPEQVAEHLGAEVIVPGEGGDALLAAILDEFDDWDAPPDAWVEDEQPDGPEAM